MNNTFIIILLKRSIFSCSKLFNSIKMKRDREGEGGANIDPQVERSGNLQ